VQLWIELGFEANGALYVLVLMHLQPVPLGLPPAADEESLPRCPPGPARRSTRSLPPSITAGRSGATPPAGPSGSEATAKWASTTRGTQSSRPKRWAGIAGEHCQILRKVRTWS